jgi:hypothetical protein
LAARRRDLQDRAGHEGAGADDPGADGAQEADEAENADDATASGSTGSKPCAAEGPDAAGKAPCPPSRPAGVDPLDLPDAAEVLRDALDAGGLLAGYADRDHC